MPDKELRFTLSDEKHRIFRVHCSELGVYKADILRQLVDGWIEDVERSGSVSSENDQDASNISIESDSDND